MDIKKSLVRLSLVATVLFTTSIVLADENSQNIITGDQIRAESNGLVLENDISGQTETHTTQPSNDLIANADKELMAKGMWRDPKTGLVWMRCLFGVSYANNWCSTPRDSMYNAKVVFYKWSEAIEGIRNLSFGGYSDWRMPTIAELQGVATCNVTSSTNNPDKNKYSYSGGVIEFSPCNNSEGSVIDDKVFARNSWDMQNELFSASTACEDDLEKILLFDRKHGDVDCVSRGSKTDKGISEDTGVKAYTLVVRGGDSDGEFQNAYLEAEKSMRLTRKSNAIEAAVVATKEASNRKERELKNQKAIAFRKSVKPGDYSSRGLVLEVRGDLVLIQKKEVECLVMNVSGSNNFCAKYGGLVVTGQEWFNRNNISP